MKTRKLLWKLFPNTLYAIWRDALIKGQQEGQDSYKSLIDQRIRKHDLSDFSEPNLTLGYTHAVKAIRGELRDVV